MNDLLASLQSQLQQKKSFPAPSDETSREEVTATENQRLEVTTASTSEQAQYVSPNPPRKTEAFMRSTEDEKNREQIDETNDYMNEEKKEASLVVSETSALPLAPSIASNSDMKAPSKDSQFYVPYLEKKVADLEGTVENLKLSIADIVRDMNETRENELRNVQQKLFAQWKSTNVLSESPQQRAITDGSASPSSSPPPQISASHPEVENAMVLSRNFLNTELTWRTMLEEENSKSIASGVSSMELSGNESKLVDLLKKEVSMKDQQIRMLFSYRSIFDRSMERIQQENTALSAELLHLKEERELFTTDVGHRMKEWRAKSEECRALELENDRLQSELSESIDQCSGVRLQVNTLQAEIELLKRQVAHQDAVHSVAMTPLKEEDTQDTSTDWQMEYRKACEREHVATERVQAMREECSQLQRGCDGLIAERENLENQNAQLKKQLRDLEGQMDTLNTEFTSLVQLYTSSNRSP